MTLDELENHMDRVDVLCRLVLEEPADIAAREQLFNALSATADLFGRLASGNTELSGLIKQADLQAEIARVRIEASRDKPGGHPFAVASIGYAVRELRGTLSSLIATLREEARP
ncbi:MAG: hypothetical protein GEV13_10885 [Rhodospirillales bacterium]|nr:hypothetical protein [Rhodospirillales bacterium]